MGASTSDLTSEEVSELQKDSNFSARDIHKLYKRFVSLDRNHKGFISTSDFQLIPELSMNPLCHRIISLFDTKDGSDQVNFRRFVETLSVFTENSSRLQKLKLAFQCYDIDGDNLISEKDLFDLLKLLVGSNIDDKELINITHNTIQQADHDHDGALSFQEFDQALGEQVVSSFTFKV